MADNYLEQRMEDMRAGRLAKGVRPKRKPFRGKLAGKHAVILASDNTDAAAAARLLRQEGATVDIIGTNLKSGNLAAQYSGARFHHLNKDNLQSILQSILSERGTIDISITLSSNPNPAINLLQLLAIPHQSILTTT